MAGRLGTKSGIEMCEKQNTEQNEPCLVQSLAHEKVVGIAQGGSHHSVVWTVDGKAYSFGEADQGRLGLGDPFGSLTHDGAVWEPQRICFDDPDEASDDEASDDETRIERISHDKLALSGVCVSIDPL